jgi:hypothetical protein
MNNSTTLRMSLFMIAAALLAAVTTTTVGMVPAAYAGGDDDGDDEEKDGERYDKGGDGNKQKVEDESTAVIADCDDNVGENAHMDCHASNGIRFTGQDVMLNGISKTLLSDEPDPSPQTMDSFSQMTSSLTDLPLPL